MNGLGDKLKEWRTEKGFTQPQLAEKINVSKAIISFWENDINEPKASNLIALAELYKISLDELVGREYNKNTQITKTYNNHGIQNGNVNF